VLGRRAGPPARGPRVGARGSVASAHGTVASLGQNCQRRTGTWMDPVERAGQMEMGGVPPDRQLLSDPLHRRAVRTTAQRVDRFVSSFFYPSFLKLPWLCGMEIRFKPRLVSKFFEFYKYYSTFVFIWQLLFNYRLTRLKRFISRFTVKLCN